MASEDDFLVVLRQITHAIDLQSKKLLKQTGLTAPQLLVLHAVAKTGRAKASEIAREIVLSPATVTSIIDRLEKAELVRRERSTTDRRVVDILLTEEGVSRLENAPELLQAGFLREFRKLEDWERSLLLASFQRVAAMMNAEDLDVAPIMVVGELTPAEPGKV
jgi:DNA-binding MarR family transcriptional regulator